MKMRDTVYNYISNCEEYDLEHGIHGQYSKKIIKSTISGHIKSCDFSEVHAYSYYNSEEEVCKVVLECVSCGKQILTHK